MDSLHDTPSTTAELNGLGVGLLPASMISATIECAAPVRFEDGAEARNEEDEEVSDKVAIHDEIAYESEHANSAVRASASASASAGMYVCF